MGSGLITEQHLLLELQVEGFGGISGQLGGVEQSGCGVEGLIGELLDSDTGGAILIEVELGVGTDATALVTAGGGGASGSLPVSGSLRGSRGGQIEGGGFGFGLLVNYNGLAQTPLTIHLFEGLANIRKF